MFLVFIFTRGCSCAVARRGCLLVGDDRGAGAAVFVSSVVVGLEAP